MQVLEFFTSMVYSALSTVTQVHSSTATIRHKCIKYLLDWQQREYLLRFRRWQKSQCNSFCYYCISGNPFLNRCLKERHFACNNNAVCSNSLTVHNCICKPGCAAKTPPVHTKARYISLVLARCIKQPNKL